MATTNDKLDYLLEEVNDLQARVVGLSAVIDALVATHPDAAGLHEYLMKMRGSIEIGAPGAHRVAGATRRGAIDDRLDRS
jgi:hypothetical protein